VEARVTERRKFLRFNTALNAFCESLGKISAQATNVINISKEGALLLLDKRMRNDEEIKLSLDIPGDNIPIVASGRIAWQKEKAGHRGGLYETGVRFTDINSVDKGRLLEYIYTQWLRVLDKV
jgi:hypothetical protein